MSIQKKQTKYWMFTINNPSSDDEPNAWPYLEYAVWQKEKGAEGTEHLQGYVILDRLQRISGMKKIHKTAHWEGRQGTHAQAKAYCTKEDTRVAGPWEIGEEPVAEQGKRNDLLSLKRALDSGQGEAAIATSDELFPVWAKYAKCIPRYNMLKGRQRDWQTYTHVIWGAPGVGKTRKARHLAGETAFWLSRPAGQTVWFDGYIGQKVVVIDEFYGWISLDLLCRILDRYPLNVETKGGSTPFVAETVYITSNVAPDAWYPNLPPQRTAALQRRLQGVLGKVERMLVPFVPLPPILEQDDEDQDRDDKEPVEVLDWAAPGWSDFLEVVPANAPYAGTFWNE